MENNAIHRRAFRGGVVSGINFAVNVALNVLQVWVLLHWWSRETYGLWLSVVAASTLLTAFDAGHLTYVGNKMTAEWPQDRAAVRRTMGSAIRMIAVTGALQIAIILWLCATGRIYSALSIEPAEGQGFAAAVIIYATGWIAMSSLASIVVRVMPAGGYFVRGTVWGMAIRILQFCALVVAAMAGWSLPWVGLFYHAVGLAIAWFFYRDIWRLFPDLTPWWRWGDMRTGFANLAKSTVLTATGVLDALTLQGLVLFVAGALGAGVVPLFTTLRTMANTAIQGTAFLLAPVAPDIVRFQVRREPAKLAAVFQFFWFSSGLLFNAGMVAALIIVEPFYRIWTQGKLAFDPVLFAWLAASVILRSWGSPLYTLITSLNWLRAQTLMTVIRTGTTLLGVAVLYPMFGLGGIGAALAFAELLGSVAFPAMVVHVEFSRLDGRFPARDFALAGLSAAVALLVLAAFPARDARFPWVMVGVLAALGVIAFLQWRLLPADVRTRVRSLVTPHRAES